MIAQGGTDGESAETGPDLDRGPGRGREPVRTCIVTRKAQSPSAMNFSVCSSKQTRFGIFGL